MGVTVSYFLIKLKPKIPFVLSFVIFKFLKSIYYLYALKWMKMNENEWKWMKMKWNAFY